MYASLCVCVCARACIIYCVFVSLCVLGGGEGGGGGRMATGMS